MIAPIFKRIMDTLKYILDFLFLLTHCVMLICLMLGIIGVMAFLIKEAIKGNM
jgi:hypothetical protein